MKKIQISLPEVQLSALKEISKGKGISFSELIRRISDNYLDKLKEKEYEDKKRI